MRLIRCLVTIAFIVLAPTAGAQTITGTVQSGGRPIVGATVRLLELDRIAHTGAQGEFTFSDVPKGNYRVFAGVTGYASAMNIVAVTGDNARTSFDLRESAFELKDVVVSEGTLSASLVHPREVFKPAILESAASIILLHNHPSGDPTPSREDLRLTRQLVECSKLLDLRIHDHVIIGRERFISLAQRGAL